MRPLLVEIVPEVVERCSQLEAGICFLENDIFSSGFQAKPSHCKLVRDFSTFLGQRNPTSLLKHLTNASNGTMLLESGHVIRAKFVRSVAPGQCNKYRTS